MYKCLMPISCNTSELNKWKRRLIKFPSAHRVQFKAISLLEIPSKTN